MNTAALRESIRLAHRHEADTGHLARLLDTRLDRLHPAIRLPQSDPRAALAAFVAAYLDEVPELLDAAADVARDAGIEAQVKPVLKVAEQFFLQPPALLDGHEGLDGLLDEAYLAHRLVEEVNDRYIAHFGRPLIPLDTTVANLIAHQLIGEPFANRLDEAVRLAVEGLLDERAFAQDSALAYRARLDEPAGEAAWRRWPCLSRRLGLDIRLEDTPA